MTTLERMAEISDLILQSPLQHVTERDLQAGISVALEPHVLELFPEHRLSARDRVDFMVTYGDMLSAPDRIAIEVKVKGSLRDVVRQLTRYSEHDDVDGILLVTTLSKHHHIPHELNGIPVRLVSLIGAGL